MRKKKTVQTQDKYKEIKDVYNVVWGFYSNLFNELDRHEKNLNYLLVISGLLLTGFLTLFGKNLLEGNMFYFIPLIFLLAVIIFVLYTIIDKKFYIPLFNNYKGITKNLDEGSFWPKTIETIIANGEHIIAAAKEKKKVTYWAVILIILAIASSFVITVLNVKSIFILKFIIVIFIFLFMVILIFAMNNRKKKSWREYYDSSIIESHFKEWLENNKQ